MGRSQSGAARESIVDPDGVVLVLLHDSRVRTEVGVMIPVGTRLLDHHYTSFLTSSFLFTFALRVIKLQASRLIDIEEGAM